MPKRVEVIETQTIFKRAIFRVKLARLRHELFDGSMSVPIERMNFERGDSVAAIMHNPDDDTILFVEQFRYPAYTKGSGWPLELPAGIVEGDEKPDVTAHREIQEETGYAVALLHPIGSYFLSPGGSSERIFIFYARIDPNNQVAEGGGLDNEHEYIRNLSLSVDEALTKLEANEINDAKTAIALQWLNLNRDNLDQLSG